MTDPSHDPSDAAASEAPRPPSEAEPPAEPPEPDLRAARVVSASDHPDADRLLVLQVDLGDERRQIVAGLVGHYAPEELEGRTIVVVANLEAARLRGEVSQGMLLAAEAGDELGVLEAPGAEPGTPIRRAGGPAPAPSLSFTEFQEHELRAEKGSVTLDGDPLVGADLRVDRGVEGRLR